MKLLLWFTLLTMCSVHFTQAGIYRRYVRRARSRPPLHMGIMTPVPMTMVPNDQYFARRDYHVAAPNPWPSMLIRRARSPWPWPPMGLFNFHRAPRHHFGQPNERRDTVPHFHHQPTPGPIYGPPRHQMHNIPAWKPIPSNYGDPTFDYSPPAMERVRFHSENRRTTSSRAFPLPSTAYPNRPPHPPHYGFSPRPSLLKMLTHKQRPMFKRPFVPRPFNRPVSHSPVGLPVIHHNHHPNQIIFPDDDIFPTIPQSGYSFHPSEGMRRPPTPHLGYSPIRRPPPPPPRRRPGMPTSERKKVEGEKVKDKDVVVGSVENYSGEATSSINDKPKPTVATTGANKEYIFTVVGYKGPSSPPPPPPPMWSRPKPISTTLMPNLLHHAVKTTPLTVTSTRNTAEKPSRPTASLQKKPVEKVVEEKEEDDEELGESVEEEIAKIEKLIKQGAKQDTIIPTSSDSQEDEELSLKGAIVPQLDPVFPNSFNILDSIKTHEDNSNDESSLEFDENEIPASVVELPSAKPRPVFNNAVKTPLSESYKTSTSISISVSKTEEQETSTKPSSTTTSSTTTKPPSTTTTSTSTTTTPKVPISTSPRPTKFPKLPTMPTYKKKPTPVYARKNKHLPSTSLGKYASSSSSSALAKDMNGSGEIVVITGGRSKVKEYKPQFINGGGENTPLITFDKVAESSKSNSKASNSKPSPSKPTSTTTTKSPLQEFDPMQLLHSWFSKD